MKKEQKVNTSSLSLLAIAGLEPYKEAKDEEYMNPKQLKPRDRERKLIKKIEKTLKKIEIDDFGFCESCGVEIGIRRLEARPTADLCIDCKTLAELREKQMGM